VSGAPTKGPSHNWETEKALLGGLLLAATDIDGGSLLDEVAAILAPHDRALGSARYGFHRPAHGDLFALILERHRAGKRFDEILVLDQIETAGTLAQYGGVSYIRGLPQACVSVQNVPAYAQRIADHAIRRAMELSAMATIEEIREGVPSATIMERVAAGVAGLAVRSEDPSMRAAAAGAALGWVRPDAAWLSTLPPERECLLYDAPTPDERRRAGMLGVPAYEIRGPGMLPRGKVGILAAAGGVGKTYALTGLALSIVTGRPWLGHFPVGNVGGHVAMILGEEDGPEIHRRLYAQAAAMGIGPSEGPALDRIRALPGAGLSLTLVEVDPMTRRSAPTDHAGALLAFLRLEAERGGFGWDAVLLDPLSRFAGADAETDNAAATRLIEQAERFTQLPGGPSVILAHHTRKPDDKPGAGIVAPASASPVRGSSALVDGARWVGALVPAGDRLASFAVVKSNYARYPRPADLAHPAEGLVLYKPDGGGIRKATPAEREEHEPRTAPKSPTSTRPTNGARYDARADRDC
jgi:hypothetical protein